MKNIGRALAGYGAFLILIGLIGYLSNPEKAKTALISGGTFGLLNIALAWLAFRGQKRAVPIAIGVAVFLGAVFSWRTTVTWLAYAEGNPDKLTAAALISAMLVATICVAAFLIRTRRRAAEESR